MINSEHLCMSCMREIGAELECPYCHYVVGTPQISPYLNVRSVIGNRYLVGRLLEYNGDGATYIAWDIQDKKAVTIREFLPDTLCSRTRDSKVITVSPGCEIAYNDCKADFLELWRKLTRMSGLSALVNVYEVFEENNTAYAICEYIESITLRDYLLRIKTGYIPWERAKTLFMPMLSTLGMLHTAGIIHRGISPFTLQIGRDGKMRLSGFSIWQARTARSDLTAQLFPGYAAIEQYGFEGQQGPWTDLYAFAATLYRALIGTDPIEATERLTNDRLMVPGKFAEQLPAYVINGLINALQILPEDRTRSVEQLRAELSASPTATVAGVDFANEMSAPDTPRVPQRRPSSSAQKVKSDQVAKNKSLALKAGLISAIVLMLVFLIAVLVVPKLKPKSEPVTQPVTTSGEQVAVGLFVGKYYSEITNNAYWLDNFKFEKKEEYSDTVKKDMIIAQSVEQGKQVNKGTTIVLTVSLGIEQIKLPDVRGMDYEEAKALLTDAGFRVSKKLEANYGGNTPDTVKSVEDADGNKMKANEEFDKGTTVKLYVWGEVQETEATTPPETTTKKEPTKPNVIVDESEEDEESSSKKNEKETTTKKGTTEKETTTKKGTTEKETTTKKGTTEKETTTKKDSETTTKKETETTTKKASA